RAAGRGLLAALAGGVAQVGLAIGIAVGRGGRAGSRLVLVLEHVRQHQVLLEEALEAVDRDELARREAIAKDLERARAVVHGRDAAGGAVGERRERLAPRRREG